MKKIVIINSNDFGIYDDLHYEYILISKMFYHLYSFQYMRNHQIDVIPLVDIIDDHISKYNVLNDVQDKQKIFENALFAFVKIIEESNLYDQCIIFIISDKVIDIIKNNMQTILKKRIRTIFYTLNRSSIEYSIDHNISIILTSSMVSNDTVSKQILFYVPPIPIDLIYLFNPDNYFDRRCKTLVLTSHSILFSSINREIMDQYLEMEDHSLSIFGETYGRTFSQYHSYLTHISNYRAAFCDVTCLSNNTVYTLFEILATGTLLISNNIDLLAKIGLISYVHYVPINEELMNEDQYWSKFIDTEIGKEIAFSGYKFIQKYFGNVDHLNFFINLINVLLDERSMFVPENNHIILIDPIKIDHYQGNLYKYQLPKISTNTFVKIYENQIEMTHIHSSIADIINFGSGRFLHQNNILYFSSIDNSNPKNNQKIYQIMF